MWDGTSVLIFLNFRFKLAQFAHRRFFYSEVFVPALVAGIFLVNASQKKPPSGAAQLPARRWLDSTETRNVPPTAWNEKNGGVSTKIDKTYL